MDTVDTLVSHPSLMLDVPKSQAQALELQAAGALPGVLLPHTDAQTPTEQLKQLSV